MEPHNTIQEKTGSTSMPEAEFETNFLRVGRPQFFKPQAKCPTAKKKYKYE
jgi:hypothetical protein